MKYLVERVFKMPAFDRGCLKRSISATSVSTATVSSSRGSRYDKPSRSAVYNLVMKNFKVLLDRIEYHYNEQKQKNKKNSMVWVRERTMPTERHYNEQLVKYRSYYYNCKINYVSNLENIFTK
jgi:hypothetical protein